MMFNVRLAGATFREMAVHLAVADDCYTQNRAPGCMTSCAACDGGG